MLPLHVLVDRNNRAILSEYYDALDDWNLAHCGRIRDANPDLFPTGLYDVRDMD